MTLRLPVATGFNSLEAVRLKSLVLTAVILPGLGWNDDEYDISGGSKFGIMNSKQVQKKSLFNGDNPIVHPHVVDSISLQITPNVNNMK